MSGLYDGRPPHVRGSDTSEGAAESVAGETARLRRRVLGDVAGCADGATCDEVEVRLGLRHQTCSARIRELVLLGRLVDTGAKRRTRSGTPARVYRLAPAAPAAARP